MKKKYQLYLISPLLLLVVCFSLFHTQGGGRPRYDCPIDSIQIPNDTYRLFFLRHIDSIFNDTLYSVCYLSPEGDTIRVRIPFHYDNPDTTIWLKFYLRNNGDTIICDDHSDLLLDSLPGSHSSSQHPLPDSQTNQPYPDSITSKERAVISEVQQYLKDYQQIENRKQNDSIQN